MKLIKAQITNFRSVEDSGVFEVGDLTCLVGKNEAGKTAILKALHGLGAYDDFEYDKTRDYPRRFLNKFEERHRDGKSSVARTWWLLDKNDVAAIENSLGKEVLISNEVEIVSHIGSNENTWFVSIDERKCLNALAVKLKLNEEEKEIFKNAKSTRDALRSLEGCEELSERAGELLDAINEFTDSSATLTAIEILEQRKPDFFYTSHFERMSGEVSLNQLAADKLNNNLKKGDQIFLDFLEYAGTTIEALRDTKKHEDLVAQCEGASNDITDEIFEFWSQNQALAVKIELNEGRSGDPHPFNSGKVAKIRIENQNHRATVPLSERSAGFVWFFSFLAQFKQLKKSTGNAIILLDEPGLTLHGKAQSDLLRYIETRLLPEHQVIYTTHSPFLVPTARLADVRVVEDVVDYRDPRKPVVKGTKVTADVLSVDKDTLFPLQAHLGYEITQTLFVGKHTLLVEGPSDVLYFQILSKALQTRKRNGLDSRWTICPSGGLDKVSSFASLFAGNNLDIAIFCDYGSGDKGKVERLRQSQILRVGRILTATDFTDKPESDIEDLFDPNLYLDIVNKSLGLGGESIITLEKLNDTGLLRTVKQVEAVCNTLSADAPEFNHYLPADWLLKNPDALDGSDPAIEQTLDRFEKVFAEFNSFLST